MLHAALADCISQHVRVSDHGLDRRHVDDRAAIPLRHHLVRRRLVGEEEPLEVHPHDAVEVVFLEFEDIGRMDDGRVGDHHIEPTPFLDRRGN